MEEINDYAMPTMMAEKALRAVHWAACSRKYDEALDEARKAIEATKDIYRALARMKERES